MISAVIITRNEERNIIRTLESLSHKEVNEIIVVDGNSSDKTRELINEFATSDNRISLIPINEGHLTAARGRQKGLENLNSDCEYVLFLDGDMELDSNFLDTAIAILKVSDIVGLTGQRSDYIYNDNYKIVRKVHEFYDVNKEMFLGGAFIVKHNVIKKFGKFDEKFPVLEETFFYQRLKENGGIIIRIPDKMFIHHMYNPQSKKHLLKRLTDRKLQSFGIILFYLKKGQIKTFIKRISPYIKSFIFLVSLPLFFFLSVDYLVILIYLVLGIFFLDSSPKKILYNSIFILLIPVGILSEFFRK